MIALRRLFRAVCLFTLWALPLSAAGIDARVTHAGVAMEHAVVYAIPEGRVPPPTRQTAVMDQRDRMFIPHVLPVQTGTAVQFPNSDDIRHHVYSFSPAKNFQLPLYKGNPASPVVFDKPGIVTLGCNIHDRMTAFIVIVDTPYFATSDTEGRAQLNDLPSGRYTVHVWYADMRNEPSSVSLTLSGDQRQDVSFALSRRSKDGDGIP